MDFVESIKNIQGILSNHGKRLVIDHDGIRASDCNEKGAHSATTYTPESLASSFQIDVVPEWNGTGLPPVGCECEVETGYGDTAWSPCEVVAITERSVVVFAEWCPTERLLSKECSFRPIRTEEEKRREADRDRLKQVMNENGYDPEDVGEIINDILDAGFTRKPDEQKPQ